MPIEINGLPTSQVKNTGDGSPARVGRDDPSLANQENGRPSTSDTVSLTDAAARLKSLEEGLESLPVVDSQRVEALKKAIADGSYEIDAARVADKLLSFERQLEGKRRP